MDNYFSSLPDESVFDSWEPSRDYGVPLKQVTYYYQLSRTPGTFWVEDDGMTLHFRLPDDGSPLNHVMEFTARESVFRPKHPYLA